jgi:hypothetical protein
MTRATKTTSAPVAKTLSFIVQGVTSSSFEEEYSVATKELEREVFMILLTAFVVLRCLMCSER